MAPIQYDIKEWLQENEKCFAPPICHKLMYKAGQLKTFFEGGPNFRTEFHMEEGEEFFYMLKGDMRLVVEEKGQFRGISIKEGEVFLLPACIPHSPQRFSGTIGLVIERERLPSEKDCLRYYKENSQEILYEQYFYCQSKGGLGPLINEYFASEEYKAGKPIPASIMKEKLIKQDLQRQLENPFPLKDWLKLNSNTLRTEGKKKLFEGSFVSRIHVLGEGEHTPDNDLPEIFLLQIEGASVIHSEGKEYKLIGNQTMVIPKGDDYMIKNEEGGRILSVVMNPVQPN